MRYIKLPSTTEPAFRPYREHPTRIIFPSAHGAVPRAAVPVGDQTRACAAAATRAQEHVIALDSRHGRESRVTDTILRNLKYKQLRSKSNSLYFSQEIGCFWDIFVSFRNKVWSGGKRRDVKTNNALCVAVFQSKKPLVG